MKRVLIICTALIIITIFILFFFNNRKDDNSQAIASDNVVGNKPDINDIQKGLYDEIINRYLSTDDNQVVDTNFRFFEKQNVLVEIKYKTGLKKYDICDVETNEYHSLPLAPTSAEFYRFISENDIDFLSDGTNTISPYREFPYIINCFRNSEESDYEIKTEPFFLNVAQEVLLGANRGSIVAYEIMNIDNGFEISFKPADSNKGDFYAGFTYIPITHTLYSHTASNNVETSQLIFEFENTQFDASINNETLQNIKSEYYKGAEIKNDGCDCRLIINLQEKTKQYYVNILHREDEDIPYAVISFK